MASRVLRLPGERRPPPAPLCGWFFVKIKELCKKPDINLRLRSVRCILGGGRWIFVNVA